MGQGWTQIVVYAAILLVLAYPLGIWMARVYTREGSDPVERWFLRVLGRDGAIDMDWKAYAKSVLVFSVVFSAFLYALLRLQGHLFLNPDHLKGVPWGVALNATASFVTNTNWQYYGGEYHDVVPRARWPGLPCRTSSRRASGWPCSSRSSAASRAEAAARGSGTSGATSTARSPTCCCPCRSCWR